MHPMPLAATAPLSPVFQFEAESESESDRRQMLRHALPALGVGGFAIGTGEFVIMGLQPEVAADIGVSMPRAGHVISAYALGVVIGSQLLAVLTAN